MTEYLYLQETTPHERLAGAMSMSPAQILAQERAASVARLEQKWGDRPASADDWLDQAERLGVDVRGFKRTSSSETEGRR